MQPTANLPDFSPGSDSAAKRMLDFIIALFLLIVLSPIFAIVALLVVFTSPGPIFYRQKRVGRNGHCFAIYKFRTMRNGADKHGPAVTATDDERITRIGRILRDIKLDEFPQLWNVVLGDMSLVGPRPQVPCFVEHFTPSLREVVLSVRPGITGPTSLYFRHEERMLADQQDREGIYIQHILPYKLVKDADYVCRRTLLGDLLVLVQTTRLFGAALARRIFRLQAHPGNPKTRAPYTLEELRADIQSSAIPHEAWTQPHSLVADIHLERKERKQEPHVLEVPYETAKETARQMQRVE